MHTPEEQAWDGGDLLEEIEVANVTDLRDMRRKCSLSITIRHPDVPEGVSLGTVYLEATPGLLLEALETHIPAFLRNLEARISASRRSSLPPDSVWRAVYGEGLAFEGLVRRGAKW
jgi:hypothetical protein